MKWRWAAVPLLAVIMLGFGGCAVNEATYEDVREDAISSLEKIVGVIPDPKEVAYQPEGEPYPCDDSLLLSSRKGAFFTGHWLVYVPEEFDIDAFIDALPVLLGEDWEKRDPAITVSFANVDMFYKPLGLTVSIEDALTDDRPALELLVISRCGALNDDDRPSTPNAPDSPPPSRYRH